LQRAKIFYGPLLLIFEVISLVDLKFVWKLVKDLHSIDPDERELLWSRFESYGVSFSMAQKELAEQILDLQKDPEYVQTRNLGDWNNIAKVWIEDRKGDDDAKDDKRTSIRVMASLLNAKLSYSRVKNLRLDTRVRNSKKRNYWIKVREDASKTIRYDQKVLDQRMDKDPNHPTYDDLMRQIRRSRRHTGRRPKQTLEEFMAGTSRGRRVKRS